MDIFSICREAARAGGEVIARHYHAGTRYRYKAEQNLVSDADVEAEETIVSVIRRHCPDHRFLGEESHNDSDDGSPIWVIDPLDGTNNFVHRFPQFASSVAFYDKGRCEAGAVYNPISGELFEARRGCGATLNGRSIVASENKVLSEALVATGFYYDRGEMMERTLSAIRELFGEHIHGIRRLGAASLDLCFVACGRFDSYFEFELHPWDFGAGALILTEAGGRICACDGSLLQLRRSSVLGTNAYLQQTMLDIIAKYSRSLEER